VTRIATGLSRLRASDEAVAEAVATVRAGLGSATPDLVCLFLSSEHAERAAATLDAVHAELAPRHLIGCVAEGIVGGDRELEQGPALSLWAASLPEEAEIETFHAVAFSGDEGVAVTGFPELDEPDLVAVCVDFTTFPATPFVERLNELAPDLPLVGGIAAGGPPGRQTLLVDDRVVHEGLVGVSLRSVPVRTVVSQGCAPIGREAVVTAAEDNVVYELAGEPALDRLRVDVESLSPELQALALEGLMVGLVIDENKAEYGRGDYLIRGLVGADEDTGAIAVGADVRVGQTLRFHVRDARSADEDLLHALGTSLNGERAAGALLFTCNGRGTGMFGEPHHDARAVTRALGTPALAGFFCGGEIGPVGGRAFVHGFTATLAVFLES
jgi:small ligand-binding sensory domain FIST